jgi:hypothetical protein
VCWPKEYEKNDQASANDFGHRAETRRTGKLPGSTPAVTMKHCHHTMLENPDNVKCTKFVG